MKYFYTAAFIFCFLSSFSQSLPINFEGDVATSNFVNFDGGTATVVNNPLKAGNNTSDFVGQIIRDGGANYGGSKIILTNNLDFSVLTKISMKVYTTAPVGTVVKFKLEGTGAAKDVDATTTVSGAWETLEWIFVGTPNDLNEVVLMFDFGNVGDGSANSTFYFDDIAQIEGPKAPKPTDLPIDFETTIVATDFLNYSGATASVIDNPEMDENNGSAKVGQIIRDGGQFWAGSKIFLNNNIDLTNNWHISMKVFTNAPIGTRIKLELENPSGRTNLDYLTTTTGTWETATWNFDGQANTYNRIQFLFDFGNVGDGTATSIFLFDDIKQIQGPAIPNPKTTTLPIDFESEVVSSDFTNYFGAVTTVVSNPKIDEKNPSQKVGQFLRSGGDGYMRSKIALEAPLENMNSFGTFSMKVYTDAPVGSILKFKLENKVPNAFGKEIDAFTTVSGEWETYTWDLSNSDSPIYDVITLMLGYNGASDASANATFLFDDIQLISNTLSTKNDESTLLSELSVYPNPVKNIVTIAAKNQKINTITIFNLLGKQVGLTHPNSLKTEINVSNYKNGIYFAKIANQKGIGTIKFIVE